MRQMRFLSKYAKQFCLFLATFFIVDSFAQTGGISEQTILEKMDLYAKAYPSNLLFVHTDKTIYANNETIWFSGYLIRVEASTLKDHTILSVSLMREDNKKTTLHNKYVMENGLSFGSLTLPDSILPGNYQFIASTNILDKQGQPLAVYTQPITIKSITEQDFNAELSLLDTVITKGVVRAKVTMDIKQPDPTEKISINYSVGKGVEQSVTLKKGERSYVITIPREELNQFQPALLTAIKYKKNVQYLNIRLPEARSEGIHIRFFPESGNLVEGLESLVGWEAKTTQGVPVPIMGILHRDEQPVDTLKTTSYGAGTFRLKPNGKSNYTLKIASNPYLARDTIYQLPKAVTKGITLHVKEAIVNDTLQVSLSSKETRNLQVLIHNYRKLFASFNVNVLPAGKNLSIAIGPLIPKGIATVTILDEAGRPLAERLFFAHYDAGIRANIQPDKQVYNRKEKVSVKLKLTDQTGQPVQGIVSIAAVQDNRIESGKEQDIGSYLYLNDVGELPQNPHGSKINNKEYLENMFLIKGWRRYTWKNLMNSSAADTLFQTQIRSIKGSVRYANKPLKKPTSIISLRDSLVTLITTETDGSFELNRDNSTIMQGRHVFLSVNEKIKEGYTIAVENPFIQINQQLAESYEIRNHGILQRVQSTVDQELKGMERVIALQTVIIDGNRGDNSLYGTRAQGIYENACGDYVCENGYLNCRAHPKNARSRAPMKGKLYHGILYKGCVAEEKKDKNEIFKVSGTYISREFYGVNTDPSGVPEPQFLSTLFWKPGVVPNNNGQTEFSFFTGDITGKFRIVVQGIGKKDVIYGASNFIVK